jgi:hypothetical protein
MNRLPMSKAAAGLLRGLLNRAGTERNRILLIDLESTDWQSLIFVGERHHFRLSIAEPGAPELLARITAGLDDAEFEIPGQVVADVVLADLPEVASDGSVTFSIEALTIAE